MSKATIRERILQQRRRMAAEEHDRLSNAIAKRLHNLPEYQSANRVMAFYPIQNEVAILDRLTDKELYLPYLRDGSIGAARYDQSALEDGPYGTKQPRNPQNESDIDLILVPGVAFDEQRNRIGYGKGCYDEYLQGTSATTIGIAFEFQIVPELPVEQHDIPVDILVTEKRVAR